MTGNQKAKPQAQSGLENVQNLLEQLGGENGLLGPTVKQLKKLLEDPILSQTLDAAPPDHSQKH